MAAIATPEVLALLALIMTLWLASLGAVWKVANLLSNITSELRTLRADTDSNAAALARLHGTRKAQSVRSASR